MNRERIKRLRDQLASLPDEKFDLSLWLTNLDGHKGDEWGPTAHSCGTSACIGGWAIAMFAPAERINDDIYDVRGRAAELLGIEPRAAQWLFTPWELHGDSPEYCGHDPQVCVPNVRAQVTRAQAIKVLDHLIATGEVDWTVAFP